MAYKRLSTQDGVTKMNKELYDNLQDGIEELKSDQFSELIFTGSAICKDSKKGGLILKSIRCKTTQGENPSYSSPQTFTYAGVGGVTYNIRNNNLIQFSNKTSSEGDMSYTFKNGTVIASGTPSSATKSIVSFTDIPEGEYILSGCPANGNDDMYLYADVRYNNGESYRYCDYGSDVIVPIADGLKSCAVYIFTSIGSTVDAIFKPQLCLNTDNDNEFAVGTLQALTVPVTGSLRATKVHDSSYANYVDKDGQMWCCDEINIDKGITINRISVSPVSISSVITLSNGNCAGVFKTSDKVDGSVGSICDRAIYDPYKSGKEGTFYEDGTNIIFVGNTSDTLDTLRTKYNNAYVIYVMKSYRETAIDSTKLIEIYGLLSHNDTTFVFCGDNNIITDIEYATTDCAGITGLSYNMVRRINAKYSIVNAIIE